jgi:hypothetical protein
MVGAAAANRQVASKDKAAQEGLVKHLGQSY